MKTNTNTKPYRAVLFDMDGVLLDSEPLHDVVTLEVIRRFLPHSKNANKADATPNFENFSRVGQDNLPSFMGASSLDMWTSLKKHYALSASVDELVNAQWETICKKLPASGIKASVGLYELLDEIKARGMKMAIVSSSRSDFINAVIEHLGIAKYVDLVVNGFEVKNGKPAPDIYLLAAKKLSLTSDECIVIEDSTNGVAAGRSANMFVIGYNNPTSLGQDVSRASVQISSLQDVLAFSLLDKP